MEQIKNLLVPGFKAAAVEAAIKKPGRLDLALIVADQAGHCRGGLHHQQGEGRPGPSLPATAASWPGSGYPGEQRQCQCLYRRRRSGAAAAASKTAATLVRNYPKPWSCRLQPASSVSRCPWTGIQHAIPSLVSRLHPEGLTEAAEAIMTTDTFPKNFPDPGTDQWPYGYPGRHCQRCGHDSPGYGHACWFFCSPMRWWRPKL